MEQTMAVAQSKPTFVKDVILISPGVWTGNDDKPTNYDASSILNGYENTDWENMNLFLDHQDTKARGVSNWVGFVKNPRMNGGDLVGDLEIWHPLISSFIKEAKAKFGVSMTTEGIERQLSQDLYDYDIHRFQSFSLVDDPACKISWLPKSLSSGKNVKTIISNRKINLSKNFENQDNAQKELNSSGNIPQDHNSTQEPENIKKEVEKLEDKDQNKESVEEQKVDKSVEEKPEEKVEEKKTESVESKESEEVKNLSAQVEVLAKGFKELSALVQKSLSAKEEVKEETEEKTEDKSEVEENSEESSEKSEETVEPSSNKELAEAVQKLSETQKELSALKDKMDSPDRKSLSVGGNSSNVNDVNSANLGMLGFLRENANLDY